ncbi:hypothetical protein Pelo_14790 [Pelomyxa schiedti]|nr:hypothetical protein Pelo_14790 [Pelomyxa schiedti]
MGNIHVQGSAMRVIPTSTEMAHDGSTADDSEPDLDSSRRLAKFCGDSFVFSEGLPHCIEEISNSPALSTFVVSFLGRTQAGKSTLCRFLLNPKGDLFGKSISPQIGNTTESKTRGVCWYSVDIFIEPEALPSQSSESTQGYPLDAGTTTQALISSTTPTMSTATTDATTTSTTQTLPPSPPLSQNTSPLSSGTQEQSDQFVPTAPPLADLPLSGEPVSSPVPEPSLVEGSCSIPPNQSTDAPTRLGSSSSQIPTTQRGYLITIIVLDWEGCGEATSKANFVFPRLGHLTSSVLVWVTTGALAEGLTELSGLCENARIDMADVTQKPVLVVVFNNKTKSEYEVLRKTDIRTRVLKKIPNWEEIFQDIQVLVIPATENPNFGTQLNHFYGQIRELQSQVYFHLTPRQWLDTFCSIGPLVADGKPVHMCKIMDQAKQYSLNSYPLSVGVIAFSEKAPLKTCTDDVFNQAFQFGQEALARELAVFQVYYSCDKPQMLHIIQMYLNEMEESKPCSQCTFKKKFHPKNHPFQTTIESAEKMYSSARWIYDVEENCKYLHTAQVINVPTGKGKFLSLRPTALKEENQEKYSALIDLANGDTLKDKLKFGGGVATGAICGACVVAPAAAFIAGCTFGLGLPVSLLIEGSGAAVGAAVGLGIGALAGCKSYSRTKSFTTKSLLSGSTSPTTEETEDHNQQQSQKAESTEATNNDTVGLTVDSNTPAERPTRDTQVAGEISTDATQPETATTSKDAAYEPRQSDGSSAAPTENSQAVVPATRGREGEEQTEKGKIEDVATGPGSESVSTTSQASTAAPSTSKSQSRSRSNSRSRSSSSSSSSKSRSRSRSHSRHASRSRSRSVSKSPPPVAQPRRRRKPEALTAVANKIEGVATTVATNISGVATTVTSTAGGVATNVTSTVGGVATNVTSSVGVVASTVSTNVSGLATSVSTNVSGLATSVSTNVTEVAQDVADVAIEIAQVASGTVMAAGHALFDLSNKTTLDRFSDRTARIAKKVYPSNLAALMKSRSFKKVWDTIISISFWIRVLWSYGSSVTIYLLLTYDLYLYSWGELTYNSTATDTENSHSILWANPSPDCYNWTRIHCADEVFMEQEKQDGHITSITGLYAIGVTASMVLLCLSFIITDTFLIFFRKPGAQYIEHISNTMTIDLFAVIYNDMKNNFKWAKVGQIAFYVALCLLPCATIPIVNQFLIDAPFVLEVEDIPNMSPDYCRCAYMWSSYWRTKQFVECTSAAVLLVYLCFCTTLCYSVGAIPSYLCNLAFPDQVKVLQIVEAQKSDDDDQSDSDTDDDTAQNGGPGGGTQSTPTSSTTHDPGEKTPLLQSH